MLLFFLTIFQYASRNYTTHTECGYDYDVIITDYYVLRSLSLQNF